MKFILKHWFDLIEISSKRVYLKKVMQTRQTKQTQKQSSIKKHTSPELTTIQASLKKNDWHFSQKLLLDKRKKFKPSFILGNLIRIRAADKKKMISEGDTTNWSHKLYTTTDVINDTLPTYRTNNSHERYNGGLLKKIELTMEKNRIVTKKK